MKNKSIYISPKCEEYAVSPERVIAASPTMTTPDIPEQDF